MKFFEIIYINALVTYLNRSRATTNAIRIQVIHTGACHPWIFQIKTSPSGWKTKKKNISKSSWNKWVNSVIVLCISHLCASKVPQVCPGDFPSPRWLRALDHELRYRLRISANLLCSYKVSSSFEIRPWVSLCDLVRKSSICLTLTSVERSNSSNRRSKLDMSIRRSWIEKNAPT